jgi:CTP synthase (UTP-ammonia lyase)
MSRTCIGLVGDFKAEVTAHRAINECFVFARQAHDTIAATWLPTESIVPVDLEQLKEFDGIWCVPASPYRSTQGALLAIEFARTHSISFLGTCGGYQHTLLEFARNVLGLKDADHAELNPDALFPLLHRMRCPLVEESQEIRVVDESFRMLYGADSGLEGFCCRYGLNPKCENLFHATSLRIVARSEDGEARACQLKGHPFFVGTQFQPERRALKGFIHPLVNSFFAHCQSSSRPRG